MQYSRHGSGATQEAPLTILNSWSKDGTKALNFILFQEYLSCVIFQQSPLHAYVESEISGTEQKEKIENRHFLFGTHVMTLVRMCGFEASNHVDLRANFGIFADTKW